MKNISMSNGNVKVKATIFNLPAVKTCKKCLSCHKYCYARKAERMYPNVLPSRQRNLDASKSKSFVLNMVDLLRKKKDDTVRIHESGDFYSKDYILKWFAIITFMPDKKFYAYTKRDDLFTKELLKLKPKNLTLIFSVDGIQTSIPKKIPVGFDKIAIVHDTKTNCPAQLDKSLKCGVGCRKCIDKKGGKVIIFKKH